jgi:3-oxoacyl-[acyl-carrier protein] reductase
LLATMHSSDIETPIRLKVPSPIILTNYVVRHRMSDGAGGIVNISSIIASTGYNGLSVFSRSLAREIGKLGITVAIAPGFVETELTGSLGGDGPRRIAGRSALRRLPEADDVASSSSTAKEMMITSAIPVGDESHDFVLVGVEIEA